jgi:hypothetical protein
MNIKEIKIIDLIRNKKEAYLGFIRGGKAYYYIFYNKFKFYFSVPVSDLQEVGNAVFDVKMTASLLKRYIRKSINNDEAYIEKHNSFVVKMEGLNEGSEKDGTDWYISHDGNYRSEHIADAFIFNNYDLASKARKDWIEKNQLNENYNKYKVLPVN